MADTPSLGGQGENASIFEKIRHVLEDGHEFWQSRELAAALQYNDYRNFEAVIEKAKLACLNSGQSIEDHFGEATDMIEVGKGAKREVQITLLTRYACYLIIQNADPSKPVIALGQTYFAIQTRRQELQDGELENERRIFLREQIKDHNKHLAEAAKVCGVILPKDYAIFQNHGYKGLYGGMTAQDIAARFGLKKGQKILDHMGSTELAANLFRATQAEEKLRRDRPFGKMRANLVHEQVGRKVRQTIKDLGGTMPEMLPAAENIEVVKKKISAKKKPELPKSTDDRDKEST